MLGVSCETTRHGCSLWCLYPQNPFSIHIFYLVINIEKASLVKILGISVLYQFITISIDLKICTMSKALKSKMIWRCCIHNTFGKTMGLHVTMVTQLIVSSHWQMLWKCKRKWSPMIKRQLARNDLTLDGMCINHCSHMVKTDKPLRMPNNLEYISAEYAVDDISICLISLVLNTYKNKERHTSRTVVSMPNRNG